MLFFTISSNNYLAQAITLGKSLEKTNPGIEYKIGLVDKMVPSVDYSSIPWEIVEVDKIGIVDFEEFYLKYSITELSTSVKPFYFRYFFDSVAENSSVIYLDPDILVYGRFTELEKELKSYDIIITPHFTTPIDDSLKQSEEDFLNSGLYNLGFIALNKTPESLRMLSWWGERLRHKAYIDLEKGMFTDQIWINFVPLFFMGVKILLHPGYNVAYWNLHERKIAGTEIITDNGKTWPLVFFHFSGFNPGKPGIISKYQNRFTFESREDVVMHFNKYKEELTDNRFMFYRDIPCYYASLREERERKAIIEKIRLIPFHKRVIRKIILKAISYFNIVLDYSRLK